MFCVWERERARVCRWRAGAGAWWGYARMARHGRMQSLEGREEGDFKIIVYVLCALWYKAYVCKRGAGYKGEGHISTQP